ncbi:MAG: hypothetical protein IPM24_26960 [Bryobacterales bacterium]|nr:hypothetical protein [Bryobacterales bacterium]
MALRRYQAEADRKNREIAEHMLRHPQRCERCQLDWARACLARLDAEAVERVEYDGQQGLLFPTSTLRYPD